MNLKEFFRTLREVEAGIEAAHAIVVSLRTHDGGRPEVYTEVTREMAARLIVENKAKLADEEGIKRYMRFAGRPLPEEQAQAPSETDGKAAKHAAKNKPLVS